MQNWEPGMEHGEPADGPLPVDRLPVRNFRVPVLPSPRTMRGANHVTRHRVSFWSLVIGTTLFLSLEPALFLVVLALGLSAVTVWWIILLIYMLVTDALGGTPGAARCALSSLKRQIDSPSTP
jgi:hypothetical protein